MSHLDGGEMSGVLSLEEAQHTIHQTREHLSEVIAMDADDKVKTQEFLAATALLKGIGKKRAGCPETAELLAEAKQHIETINPTSIKVKVAAGSVKKPAQPNGDAARTRATARVKDAVAARHAPRPEIYH